MAGSSAGSVWLHNPMAAFKDQLQVERALELAARRDLCSQHARMSGRLHFGGELLHDVPPGDLLSQTERDTLVRTEAGQTREVI